MAENIQSREALLQSTTQDIVAGIENKKAESEVKAQKSPQELSQKANLEKANRKPWGKGTTDIDIINEQKTRKAIATKKMKSKLTTRGQIDVVGSKFKQPGDIENQ